MEERGERGEEGGKGGVEGYGGVGEEEGGVEYVWVERWFAEFVGSVGGGGEALGRGYQVGREGHWSSRG